MERCEKRNLHLARQHQNEAGNPNTLQHGRSIQKKQKLDYQLDSECAETVIISSRNAVWLPIIEKNIAEKNSFLAVGYAHLTGKYGLITKLREAGYKVEPVYDLDK